MMERKQITFFVCFCAIVFGTLSVVQFVVNQTSRQTYLRRGSGDHRVLYNNYLWQRDDDDDYFGNTNNTSYFSSNQNYKKMGNNNGNYGGSYENYQSNKDYDDDVSQKAYNDDDMIDDATSSSELSTESWFGQLSPSQSAFLGIGIGLLLLAVLFCCLFGPTMWGLFKNWLFNRKNKTGMDFTTLGDF